MGVVESSIEVVLGLINVIFEADELTYIQEYNNSPCMEEYNFVPFGQSFSIWVKSIFSFIIFMLFNYKDLICLSSSAILSCKAFFFIFNDAISDFLVNRLEYLLLTMS